MDAPIPPSTNPVTVLITDALLTQIEAWKAEQLDKPSIPESITRLLGVALVGWKPQNGVTAGEPERNQPG